ncbi:sulfatase [Planctomycetota bacterium]
MKRREFLASAGAGSLGLAGSRLAAAEDAPGGDKRPNILFIMTDQQHASMMSCTGNKWLKTPAMDSLARNGIRFGRAYAANPVCVPSRISMATGVMPGRFGVLSNGMEAKIPPEVDRNSLGKLIRRAGYDTFYGGKVHMCRELVPRNAGYDAFERDSRDRLPAACIEFIKRKRDKPFFAVASFINPHDICFAYLSYESMGRKTVPGVNRGKGRRTMPRVDRLYGRASALPLGQLPPLPENYAIPPGEPEAVEAHMSPKAVTPAITMRREYDEEQWRVYRWIYCRLTEQVDRHIGRILNAIREAGLEDRTLIVFTSDHGNMDASHQLASKGLFYEESVGVPFLMKYAGVIPKGKVDTKHLVATGLDILPTLCDYAGATPPKTLLGRSLRAIAEGKPAGNWRPYVVSENRWGRMIRSERFKYCVYDAGATRESLVDMARDGGEMKNLASDPEYREALAQHRRYLNDWIQRSGDREGDAFVVQG